MILLKAPPEKPGALLFCMKNMQISLVFSIFILEIEIV